RRRHTRSKRDWSSDVCSSDLASTPEQTSLETHPTLRDLDFWRDFHGPWYGFDHVETDRMHGDERLVGGHYAIWMEEKGLANWARSEERRVGKGGGGQ